MKKSELRRLIREELNEAPGLQTHHANRPIKMYVRNLKGKPGDDYWHVATFNGRGDAIIAMNALQKAADKTDKGKYEYWLK